MIANGRESYYARGDGENVSTVCARARICCCRQACATGCPRHLAFFVSDLIDQLDLSAITSVRAGRARVSAVPPVMMTKLLVYAYCVGVFSSRKIHRRLVEDVAFRVLAAGNAGLPHDRDFRGAI